MANQTIRISLRGYDHILLDKSTEKIVKTAKSTGAIISGPIPLPSKRSVYTILRSPHVNKKSREQFQTKIVRIDTTIDSCLLYAKNMTRWKPIRIRTSPVKHGEILYNIASPLGVATPEMVPVLNGHYSGDLSFTRSAYTIPAAPGSSGSPIFDRRGKLVGMIHSVYIRFPFLSFGPTQKRLLEFLDH